MTTQLNSVTNRVAQLFLHLESTFISGGVADSLKLLVSSIKYAQQLLLIEGIMKKNFLFGQNSITLWS